MNIIPTRTPFFIRRFFSNYVWKIPTNTKVLYLTFDDGPTPEITPWVLNQLKQYNAKATFFCIGANIKKHSSIFKSIQEEGHIVGNHTQNHIKGWKTSLSTYLKEIEFTQKNIEAYTTHLIKKNPKEKTIKLFRPPYGQLKSSQGKALIKKGYKIIMWSVLTFDWDNKLTKSKCLKKAFKAKPGDIIVFHDSIKATKNLKHTLPFFLKFYTEKGYQFKAIS